METIYWIQRLGTIHTLAWWLFALAIIAFVILCIITIVARTVKDDDDSAMAAYKVCMRWVKITPFLIGVFMLTGVFVPSEKDLYVIYGIGGTIDYIKSNDTAKQLPDKAVNALDAWLDTQIGNNNKDE